MFGLPIEAVSMIASTALGGIMKLMGQAQADKARQNELLMRQSIQIEEQIQNARKMQNPNAAWVRRFIVVACLLLGAAIVLGAPLMKQVTNVPIEVTEGFKFLFFDFTNTKTEYLQLEGWVTPEWLPVAIMNIIGFYFGAAAMKR